MGDGGDEDGEENDGGDEGGKDTKRWQVAIKSFLVLRIYNAGIRSKTIKRGLLFLFLLLLL